MTLQEHDTILFKNEKRIIYSQPLTKYFESLPQRPAFMSPNPQLISRGYYADWSLNNDNLYLTDFLGEQLISNYDVLKYTIKDLFPSLMPPIFAEWFSGQILLPKDNDKVESFHSPDEICLCLTFTKGILISENERKRQE